jgi:Holliday junction DNA helicase RuvA
MIHSMNGTVSYKGTDFFNLQTGSIEFTFLSSLNTITRLPDTGTSCTVFAYLHHKEDQMYLIGFSDIKEREVFSDLISISGIGPKQALKILSGINPEQFIAALETNDLQALVRIPGLGKKTAQKILLALQDKLVDLKKESEGKNSFKDIEVALVNMGYDKKSVSKAIEEVSRAFNIDEIAVSERDAFILKKAILFLG